MSHNSVEKAGFQKSFLNKSSMSGISITHTHNDILNIYNEYLPMLQSHLYLKFIHQNDYVKNID